MRVCIIRNAAPLWCHFTNLNCKPRKQKDKKKNEKDQKGALWYLVLVTQFTIFKYWHMYLVLDSTVILILERIWILHHLLQLIGQWLNGSVYITIQSYAHFFHGGKNHTYQSCNKQPDVLLQSSHSKDEAYSNSKTFWTSGIGKHRYWNWQGPSISVSTWGN